MKGKLVYSFLLLSLLSACSYRLPQPTVTPGAAKMVLEKGVTTQAEIFQAFGSPNFVTTTKDGGELWVYSNHARVNQAYSLGLLGLGGGLVGDALVGGGASGGYGSGTSYSRSINLMITFDKNDVVKDYTVSQLQY